MTDRANLEGQIAVVTGASRGIGRAVARELAHQGWAVGINYLNRADKARELVEELTAAGCHAAMFQADVADSAAVAEWRRRSISSLMALSFSI